VAKRVERQDHGPADTSNRPSSTEDIGCEERKARHQPQAIKVGSNNPLRLEDRDPRIKPDQKALQKRTDEKTQQFPLHPLRAGPGICDRIDDDKARAAVAGRIASDPR